MKIKNFSMWFLNICVFFNIMGFDAIKIVLFNFNFLSLSSVI